RAHERAQPRDGLAHELDVGRPVRVAAREVVEVLAEEALGGALRLPTVATDQAHQVELRDRPRVEQRIERVARAVERTVTLGVREDRTYAAHPHLEEDVLETKREPLGRELHERGLSARIRQVLTTLEEPPEDVVEPVLRAEAELRDVGLVRSALHERAVGGFE